jgi:hypothetical protein
MLPIYPAISAGAAALIKGVQSLFGFQRHWINARTITENLKSEDILFRTMRGKYKGLSLVESEGMFSETVESIIRVGNETWYKIIQPPDVERKE